MKEVLVQNDSYSTHG